jgi:hypothetical protein
MLRNSSLLLAIIGSFAALSSAKLDYGPCPSPIVQAPFDASLTGTYYLQYYDNMLDYLWPAAKLMYSHLLKGDKPDCLKIPITVNSASYDRDSRPLKKRLFQPYLVYADPTKNAVVSYMCFDARFISDLLSAGFEIPDWITDIYNKFMELFQVWHFKVMLWGSKTPVVDPAVTSDVANYINTFPHKKSFPYKFPADFSRANQDPTYCRHPV